MDNYDKKFPTMLRLQLLSEEISQEQLAKYIGVTRQCVSSWAAGKSIPNIYQFQKIVNFFNECNKNLSYEDWL